jgi:hypothetical protein
MATTLALAMKASLSAAGVSTGANQAAAAMDRLGKQAKKTAADVSTLKNIELGKLLASGAMAASRALSSAAKSALSFAANVASSVDSMNDLAARTGMGVEQLQAFQMAAKLSGVDDVTGAVQKLSVAIGQAAESGKTEAFTRLGLNFQELQAMAPEQQFQAIQQAIAALPTPAERAAAAVAIFGKSGVELLPLMSQNLAEIEERMRRLGAIVSADQVEAIGSMNDALDMVKATLDGIVGQVIGNLAPVVESLANDFLAFVEEFNSISGEGGTGVANAISNALLDIAEYFAGIFDSAVANFDGFGTTMQEVAAVFQFVGNVFTAIAETVRAAFNMFQIAGNLLAMALGKFLEGIGSWVSSDLEQFGKDLANNASEQMKQNSAEGNQALANAGNAANAAVFGGPATQPSDGPAGRAVRAARERMNDEEAKRERQAQREQQAAEQKAAREAAAADAKAKKDAEEAQKRRDEAAKKAADLDGKMADKQAQIDDIASGRARSLEGQNNEALKANDVRSSEGMAQFIALATGREDPAIEEYRKQTRKLDELKAELRALQTQSVDILGGAA